MDIRRRGENGNGDGDGSGKTAERVLPAAGPEGRRRRLREKFLRGGLSGFLDYEILELLLTLGTPRRDCRAGQA